MLTFAYYLLKVIICSGILYGYYLLALRNKIFHRWNRFYLLTAVILSLAAPLIKINIWQNSQEPQTQVIHLLQVVNTSDEHVYEYTRDKQSFIDISNLSVFIYTVVSGLLFAFLIQTLIKIRRLKHTYQSTLVEGINFINTDAKGTPFSFFNNIFWNNNIDLNTSVGKQIFQHEVAHVQEMHSYDKIFMNIVLIFFWCNPIFWLMRRELNMIHEFIADKKAVEDNDAAAFAAMILQATYPQQRFNITNNFFYSPLKRRLLMLTQNKNHKINYISHLLVLPLVAFIFFAFTLKMKTINSSNPYSGKKITVVIDAGHGGDDGGAISENGIYEKTLTLSIAQKVKELNNNNNLNIVLSRDEDETISVRQRVDFAKSLSANLFISIHIGAELNSFTNSGLNILIPQNDNLYLKESKVLGFALLESFKNNYQLQVANNLKQHGKGVWTLKANEYPSVLVEAGFITTQKDVEYLAKPENQETIAKNILNGIEKYARQNLSTKRNHISTVQYTMPPYQIQNGAAFIDTKNRIWLKADTILNTTEPNKTYVNTTKAIVIVNGKIENNNIFKNKTIASRRLTIHSGDDKKMLHKYGAAAKNGVFVFEDAVIIDKPPYYPDEPALEKNVFKGNAELAEIENDKRLVYVNDTIPQFYKGKKMKKVHGLEKLHKALIFYEDGTTDSISITEAEKLRIIPPPPPGIIRNVINKDDDKIFTKVETEAQFPGGNEAWNRYVTKVIQNNTNSLIQDKSNGTCIVKFIVNTDSTVSDVRVTTMEGTILAKVAVDAIKKGPKWYPAIQNGHVVSSYKEQPFTFKIEDKIVIKNEPQ